MKTILIADDHPIFRQGLVRIVEGTKEFRLVGEAGNGREALSAIRTLQPDLAVVDISMPEMSGLEIVRAAGRENLPVEFVILTMYREEEYFQEAMELGVRGYVLKESAVTDLMQCLKSVAGGQHYVSPALSGYLMKRMTALQKMNSDQPSLQLLTATEKQVLKLIAQNLTSREVADRLHVSFRTVQNHRANICSKLGLEGYNKLLQFAIEHKALL